MAVLHGVVVTYRRPRELEVMLARLAHQDRPPDTLLVVDNDVEESGRDAVERAPKALNEVAYLPSGANLGPAGGLALGMTHVLARAADDDWIVLLDDDDPPRTPDMLAALEDLGTTLRAADRTVAAVGMSGTSFDQSRGIARRVPDDALVGAVPSSCIGGNQLPMYSVHAVRNVGVFDERLFFGFDDLEYGLRLRAAGFGVYAHGELWLRERTHHGRLGMTTPPSRSLSEPGWRRYYSLRNLIYILRLRGHPLGAARLAARGVGKPLWNLPGNPRLAWRNLMLNKSAIVDAYAGRMGRTVDPG